MIKYVCGFCFSEDYSQVVLILKKRPSWQEGLLNGVGGKIEPGESPYQAMVREFKEETSVFLTNWDEYLEYTGENFKIHFFKIFTDKYHLVESATDESVMILPVDKLYSLNTIPNLKWLIPLAFENTQHIKIYEK